MAAQVAWLHRRLDQANEELEKANDELAQAEELVADIDKFEEIKQRKDEEISNLKKKLLQADNDDSDLIDELKKKNEELEAKVEELTRLLNDTKSAEAANDAILDDLDAGIEFTGNDEEKDQMSSLEPKMMTKTTKTKCLSSKKSQLSNIMGVHILCVPPFYFFLLV